MPLTPESGADPGAPSRGPAPKSQNFGNCDCGQPAIVKLNGKARCQPCFSAALKAIPSPLQLARMFVEAQGGTLAPQSVVRNRSKHD